jgi:predicted O-methyltransferase YrrM
MGQEIFTVPRGDYVAPGLAVVLPDDAFPNMVVAATGQNSWPDLRREIAHNRYFDKRDPTVGLVNRDEAAILYNTALCFVGRPCLEIGCWRGWSTAHIALGCGKLDVIDPVLADEGFAADVKASLARAGVLDRITLHSAPSPDGIDTLSRRRDERWAFAFIDGSHEGDRPARDAEMVARYSAADALVLFHDLLSPNAARGLGIFRDAGWHTMIYQTERVMGVAWRGAVEPVRHVADPVQPWWLPPHLATYRISGEPPDSRVERVVRLIEASLGDASAPPANFVGTLAGIPGSNAIKPRDLDGFDRLLARVNQLVERDRGFGEATEAAAQFDALHHRYLQLAAKLAEANTERARVAADADAAIERGFTLWVASPRVLIGLLRRRLRQGPQAVADLIGKELAAHRVGKLPPRSIS